MVITHFAAVEMGQLNRLVLKSSHGKWGSRSKISLATVVVK